MIDVDNHGKCKLVWRKERCPWTVLQSANGKYFTISSGKVELPDPLPEPMYDSNRVILYNDVVLDRVELRDMATQKVLCRMPMARH